jgi:hypothetical protein
MEIPVGSRQERTSMTLDEALDFVTVYHQDTGGNCPKGWYPVGTNNQGTIAYFCYESDALRYRLQVINDILNGTFTH